MAQQSRQSLSVVGGDSTASRLAARLFAGFGRIVPQSRPGAAWVLASWFAKVAPNNSDVLVEVEGGSRLWINLADPYWSRMLIPKYTYEPELLQIFQQLAHFRPTLIDGGANIGYWSIVATSKPFNFPNAIAVEASRSMFARLKRNICANSLPIELLLAAISAEDGQLVVLERGLNHSGTHIAPDQSNRRMREEVTTVTIDRLFADRPALSAEPAIIKLDVEGAEVDAMRGARRTLEHDSVVLIYEDHGVDRDCAATSWLLTNTNRVILLLQDERMIRIRNVEQLAAEKRDVSRGYNLIAIPAGGELQRQFGTFAG